MLQGVKISGNVTFFRKPHYFQKHLAVWYQREVKAEVQKNLIPTLCLFCALLGFCFGLIVCHKHFAF
jgi:hypothetical protein